MTNPQEVLVQVNVSLEKSKGGVAPAAVLHLIEQIDTMLSIRVRGLMMMAPLTDDPETVRPVFERDSGIVRGNQKNRPGRRTIQYSVHGDEQ